MHLPPDNTAASHDGTFSDRGQARPRGDRFTDRIREFEQGGVVGPAGIDSFLRVAAADLFRIMPHVERAVLEALPRWFENPLPHQRPALGQYVRTVQVLRRALATSVALETQPGALTRLSPTTTGQPS